MTDDPVAAAVGAAVAADRLRIIATLVRVTGDWELAEDSLQDAVERALSRWASDGIPDNPGAWLNVTARRRAIDRVRRRRTELQKLREVQAMAELDDLPSDPGDEGPYGDDRLKLLFACCHPALPLAGRVALTLKTVTGLSTREVARAFLVSEATMSQRLLRTRSRIANTGIAFRVPPRHRLAERTAGVLAVVYLLFNEGYAAAEGDTLRPDVAGEALQLAELLTRLLPDDDEVHGLRALLLLQHSRHAARVDEAGELLTMEEQDRGRWDRDLIDAGLGALSTARAGGRPPGYYRLQAEIAALHATSASAEQTDWPRIVAAYDALVELRPSPVIALNRAIALGFRDGPEAGLDALAAVGRAHPGDGLERYPLVPAARADLLRRAGRVDAAVVAYRRAIEVARTDPERRQLRRHLAALTA